MDGLAVEFAQDAPNRAQMQIQRPISARPVAENLNLIAGGVPKRAYYASQAGLCLFCELREIVAFDSDEVIT